MKSFSILTLILFIGCSPATNNQNKTVDSLKTVVQQKDVAYDSLKNDYKVWVTHTFDTEHHCVTFAEAVKRNPANSVFNVAWVKRTFLWTHEWKKKGK